MGDVTAIALLAAASVLAVFVTVDLYMARRERNQARHDWIAGEARSIARRIVGPDRTPPPESFAPGSRAWELAEREWEKAQESIRQAAQREREGR